MGGKDLNLKKSWHVNLMSNQKKVWEAEQSALDERKKIEQLRREREEERAMEEIAKLQEAAGGRIKQQRVDWMYQGSSNGATGVTDEQESYLLGKRRVDNLILKKDKETQESLKKGATTGAGTDAAPAAVSGITSVRDLASKTSLDPLMAIEMQKQKAMEDEVERMLRRQKIKEKDSGKSSSHRSRRHRGEDDEDRRRSKKRRYSDERDDDRRREHRSSRRKRTPDSRSPSPYRSRRRRDSRSPEAHRSRKHRDSRSPSPYRSRRERDARSRSPRRDRDRRDGRSEHRDRDSERKDNSTRGDRDSERKTEKRADRSKTTEQARSRRRNTSSSRSRSRSPYRNTDPRQRSPPRPSEEARESKPQNSKPASLPTPPDANTSSSAEEKPADNKAADRAARLAAMQSNARSLEDDRSKRLADIAERDAAEKESEDAKRLRSGVPGGFVAGLKKKQLGQGDLGDRIKGRRGFEGM